MDRLPVAESIRTCGTTRLAEEMQLPISTIHGWKQADAIPGKGTLHDLKVAAFERAVKKLSRQRKAKAA